MHELSGGSSPENEHPASIGCHEESMNCEKVVATLVAGSVGLAEVTMPAGIMVGVLIVGGPDAGSLT
ncbi:MAG: hypothetical protein Q8M65_11265, partial [Rhodoglobus sp.]|nr:hypothetical protein [Rhodoglobus sp.]